ncbi:hypothetical protein LOB54_04035 [Lactobacillus delbrueckii subsp. bulgaricus]|uniref:hypothetical protein n=1 Tax=Lactobacillus delbrueckii TaxID=1584 RepID=UPI001C1E5B76|nr:hypothetical protein [Lactobacillus delbrueckii]MBU6049072.1 hypothetical protein [Lactobacillus delbrueckii]MCD5462056.1 hypothetical protein [Lactobacillus delbrueckii subsp. bulgaricus]MCD5477455.1 hypothetical protein [Lactobacillus delbrueckii subsp. bulgaricus]UUY35341.1 hypothetical protein NUU01_07520 [Lactobacillus delbrueckii subsp. bulgaricus]
MSKKTEKAKRNKQIGTLTDKQKYEAKILEKDARIKELELELIIAKKSGRPELLALKAGADLLLGGKLENLPILEAAAESGELPKERIKDALVRVQTLQDDYSL